MQQGELVMHGRLFNLWYFSVSESRKGQKEKTKTKEKETTRLLWWYFMCVHIKYCQEKKKCVDCHIN